MTVLATIPNGASNKDIRDTLNSALARILALEAALAGGGTTPTPAPSPTVTLSAAQSKAEGNSGATVFTYTVTRSATTGAVSVPWSFTAGATSADDFTGGTYPAGGTVAFVDGQGAGTIAISVNGDTTTEPDEAFTVSISAPAGYAAGSAMSATGTILNDDTAFMAPTLLAPLYADDLDTPAGTSALAGRTNWTFPDATNAANLEVKDGYIRNNKQFGPIVGAVFGGNVGDFVATFGYSTVGDNDSSFDAGRQRFLMWWRDTANYLTLTIDPGNKRLFVGGRVSGNDLSDKFWSTPGFLAKGEVSITCRGGLLTAMLDGKWLKFVDNVYAYPLDVMDISGTVPAANRSGKVGLEAATWRYPVLEYVSVSAVGFAIDSIDEFVGRDSLAATGGKALLTGAMAAGASPSSWVARVLNYGTRAVVADWAPMTGVTVNGSQMSGFVFLPTGGPYIVQAGYVDSSDNKARVALSKAVLSGIRGEVWGQSNALYRGSASSDATLRVKVANTATNIASGMAGAPVGGWATASNPYDVNSANEAAKIIAAAIGKPVGIGVQGVGSTGLDFLSPGGVGWSTFTTAMAARRGIVEFVIWDQGENDADQAFPPNGYASTFRNTLLPGLRNVTNNPDLLVFISPIGRYAGDWAEPVRIDQQREVLRQQYLAIVAAEPNVRFSDFKLGTAHTDAYHYDNSAQGYFEMARRAGYTIAKALGANMADGRGALATTATRSGAVVDVTLDLNGGSGIAGPTTLATGTVPTATLQGRYGYQVSKDNFATTLAINSVAIVGGKLRITLAADPGAAVKVRSFYGSSYDDTTLFTTTYADGRAAIPVAPIMTPIAAA